MEEPSSLRVHLVFRNILIFAQMDPGFLFPLGTKAAGEPELYPVAEGQIPRPAPAYRPVGVIQDRVL